MPSFDVGRETEMKKIIGIFITLIAVVIIFVALVSKTEAVLPKGNKAPSFKIRTLEGKELSLADLQKDPADKSKKKKRVVLLDFWALWCPPCREYVPKLQKIHEDYRKKGLCVAGVAIDSEDTAKVKQFVKEKKLTYIILLDKDREVARLYQAPPIPLTYLIDRQGVIRYTHLGYYPGIEKDLEKEIKALLK